MTDGTPVLPTCYRHPGRQTGLRCTRCDRPICGECAIPAPVGFQCPECVHAAAATQRQPTTVAGGRVISAPVVTYALIAINVVVFGLQWLGGVNAVAGDYGMWPVGIAVNGEWWRLITAAFLHGSILHIAFNMYLLWIIGRELEPLLLGVKRLEVEDADFGDARIGNFSDERRKVQALSLRERRVENVREEHVLSALHRVSLDADEP